MFEDMSITDLSLYIVNKQKEIIAITELEIKSLTEIITYKMLEPETDKRLESELDTPFNINHCAICNSIVVTDHHILPRAYGGTQYKENIIRLCYSCHDIIELATDEWIKSGKLIDIGLFKSMIKNGVFID